MGDVEESPKMRREVEVMMQYLGAATDLGGTAFLQNRPGAVEPFLSNAEKPFQEIIRKTMKKMRALRHQPAQAMAPEDRDDIVA